MGGTGPRRWRRGRGAAARSRSRRECPRPRAHRRPRRSTGRRPGRRPLRPSRAGDRCSWWTRPRAFRRPRNWPAGGPSPRPCWPIPRPERVRRPPRSSDPRRSTSDCSRCSRRWAPSTGWACRTSPWPRASPTRVPSPAARWWMPSAVHRCRRVQPPPSASLAWLDAQLPPFAPDSVERHRRWGADLLPVRLCSRRPGHELGPLTAGSGRHPAVRPGARPGRPRCQRRSARSTAARRPRLPGGPDVRCGTRVCAWSFSARRSRCSASPPPRPRRAGCSASPTCRRTRRRSTSTSTRSPIPMRGSS